jgi:hypothetical protein
LPEQATDANAGVQACNVDGPSELLHLGPQLAYAFSCRQVGAHLGDIRSEGLKILRSLLQPVAGRADHQVIAPPGKLLRE